MNKPTLDTELDLLVKRRTQREHKEAVATVVFSIISAAIIGFILWLN